MEFPATGSGILAGTVLLLSPPPAGAPDPATPETFAAFVITTPQHGHVGDYIGLVSNAPPSQTLDPATGQRTLDPGQAGLRWNHALQWPDRFTLHAVTALGIDGHDDTPGLIGNRDPSVMAEPWAKYTYSAVGSLTPTPAGQVVQPVNYELLYRVSIAPDANGSSTVGYLHARPVSGPGGARDLEWYVPLNALTDGDSTDPPAMRRRLIDLRPSAIFERIPGPVQVGGLIHHVDTVVP